MKRFRFQIVLTAPYQTYTGPIKTGSVFSQGALTFEGDDPREFLMKEFMSRDGSLNCSLNKPDQNGKAPELEVKIEEIPLELALNAENLSKLPQSPLDWTDWSAQQALILLLSTLFPSPIWEEDIWELLQDVPSLTVSRTCFMSPPRILKGYRWFANTYTIFLDQIAVAMTLELGGAQTDAPIELKILDRERAFKVLEVVQRQRQIVVHSLKSSFDCAEVHGLDLVNGEIIPREFNLPET